MLFMFVSLLHYRRSDIIAYHCHESKIERWNSFFSVGLNSVVLLDRTGFGKHSNKTLSAGSPVKTHPAYFPVLCNYL